MSWILKKKVPASVPSGSLPVPLHHDDDHDDDDDDDDGDHDDPSLRCSWQT